MTVKELIAQLSTVNPELKVFCYNDVGEEYHHVGYLFVNKSKERKYTGDQVVPDDDNHVVLVGAKMDMGYKEK